MDARLSSPNLLRMIVESVVKLVDDVRILATADDGMTCSEMDSAHVALVQFGLKPKAFETWKVTLPQTFGLSLAPFLKLLRIGKDSDALSLQMEPQSDQLAVRFIPTVEPKNGKKQLSEKKFTYKLIDIDGQQIQVPPTTYRIEVQLPSKDFAAQLADYRTLSDTVVIRVNRTGITFEVVSTEASGKVTMKPAAVYVDGRSLTAVTAADDKKTEPTDDDEEPDERPKKKTKKSKSTESSTDVQIVINRLPNDAADLDVGNEEVVICMALNYLIRFMRGASLCPFVVLGISDDAPLLVQFPVFADAADPAAVPITKTDDDGNETTVYSLLADRDGQIGSIGYYLAAKLEDAADPLVTDSKAVSDS